MPSADPNSGFDGVKFMRAVRAEIDRETEGMSHEEYLDWMDAQEYQDPVLAQYAKLFREDRARPRAAEAKEASAPAD